MAALAAALLVRGRAPLCWCFLAYILAVLVGHTLILGWPRVFRAMSVYAIKDLVYFILKVAIALEIWRRTFSRFPRARIRVGLLIAGVLLIIAVLAHAIPAHVEPRIAIVGLLIPRSQAGLLMTYAVVVCSALWYRVPLHPFHRRILIGLAGYLSVHALAMALFAGPGFYWVGYPIEAVSFPLTLIWWLAAAARPLQAPSPTAARLHPWAHSW